MEADAAVIASVCWLKASLTAHKVLSADEAMTTAVRWWKLLWLVW